MLLKQMRDAAHVKHYFIRTERVHCAWVKQFLRFYRYRHPVEMVAPELEAFLTNLAVAQGFGVYAESGIGGPSVPLQAGIGYRSALAERCGARQEA